MGGDLGWSFRLARWLNQTFGRRLVVYAAGVVILASFGAFMADQGIGSFNPSPRWLWALLFGGLGFGMAVKIERDWRQ